MQFYTACPWVAIVLNVVIQLAHTIYKVNWLWYAEVYSKLACVISYNYRDNNIEEYELEMYFTQDQEYFGKIQSFELVPGGNDKLVTEENKDEYIK